jgi:hypothetical protein
MVHNTKNYWVFGLFPSSGPLDDVSETRSISVLRRGEKAPTQLGALERPNLNFQLICVNETNYKA